MINDFDILDNLDNIYAYILQYDNVQLPVLAYNDRYCINWLNFIPEYDNTIYITPIGTPRKVPKGTKIVKVDFSQNLFQNLSGSQLAFINLLMKLYIEGDD